MSQLVSRLRWWWFDAGQSPTGWQLQLLIADEQQGLSWAINARDDVACQLPEIDCLILLSKGFAQVAPIFVNRIGLR
jgi:hypothetical protein